MTFLGSIALPFDDHGVDCDFVLSQGERATFVLAYGHGRPAGLERYRTEERLQQTRGYWQTLVAGMDYEGLWREQVVRSFLVLHLTYTVIKYFTSNISIKFFFRYLISL